MYNIQNNFFFFYLHFDFIWDSTNYTLKDSHILKGIDYNNKF